MIIENRALDRGLTIIETLSQDGAMTLAGLHKATGLPKSTIRRCLATLCARRFVRRSLADGRYRAAVTLPAIGAEATPEGQNLLADIALPHALDLTRRIGWPSDIHARDRKSMRIVDSTRPASPFHLYRGKVNRQVNMFGSAAGMACLAQLPEAEVRALHDRTAGDPVWGLARFGMTVDGYLPILEGARARGYGERLGVYLGETVLDDQLSALAVPLGPAARPLGGLTMLWPRSFKTAEAFAAEHLPLLRETADRVAADLARMQRG